MKDQPTSVRLSADAKRLSEAYCQRHGISQTARLELAMGCLAQREKGK